MLIALGFFSLVLTPGFRYSRLSRFHARRLRSSGRCADLPEDPQDPARPLWKIQGPIVSTTDLISVGP